MVKVNQHGNYLGQGYLVQTEIVVTTRRHTLDLFLILDGSIKFIHGLKGPDPPISPHLRLLNECSTFLGCCSLGLQKLYILS